MFLYVIGSSSGPSKIGFSKDVTRRLKTLQTGNPARLKIFHVEEVPESRVRLLEKQLHKELGHKRMKGEWFNLSPDDATLMLKFAIIRWLDDPFLGL